MIPEVIHEPRRGDYIVLTAEVRLPVSAIFRMQPLDSGGALIITDRGLRRVRESYADIVAALSGAKKGAVANA